MVHAVIVLGISKFLKGGGKEISEFSYIYCRLMKALEVYNFIDDDDKIVICSGGFGQAKKMKKFLIERGILETRIVEEGNSRNTIENCLYSYEYLRNFFMSEPNLHDLNKQNSNEIIERKSYIPISTLELNIHVVTGDYHIYRSMIIFETLKYRLHFHSENKLKIFPYCENIFRFIDEVLPEHVEDFEQAKLNEKHNTESIYKQLEYVKQNL